MPIGIVEFFNRSRGFGRIRTDHIPGGIFVHYSDVRGDAKILLENELVEFGLKETSKGPKALGVNRFGERLCGVIVHYEKGFGYIKEKEKGKLFFLHHNDVMGRGFKRIQKGFQVEFSPFSSDLGDQAKEIVITDTRPSIERFAKLTQWQQQVSRLSQMAQFEYWSWPGESTSGRECPILENYLYHTFARLEEENKILFTQDENRKRLAVLHTGLVSDKDEEIFAFFKGIKVISRNQGYLKKPKWELLGFEKESHRLMSYYPRKPQIASYSSNPSEFIYDPAKRLVVDYDHILEDHLERFPNELLELPKAEMAIRLRQAVGKAVFNVRRNYRMAIPQYYDGRIQLLLPLQLTSSRQVNLALVVAQEHEIYRANTVIPLSWAYQNARLLAPLNQNWLLPS
ncbi:MAG: DUF3825 domain-containing protein [Bacteroidia bacterium]|nr:DUF3825 domain-containing protein [Bacteroidia bacterium]